MQFNYIECKLPSNGLLYPITTVHLRQKTIFDIKARLNNPAQYLKSEIDSLNSCISPDDNLDVYDLVNQDVVYLLYKLRSMSDDNFSVKFKVDGKVRVEDVKISELDVKFLDKWDNCFTLPESKFEVTLNYLPISYNFTLSQKIDEFTEKYPEYKGDVANTVRILEAVKMINNFTDKDNIRNVLEHLSFKDSLYLIDKIEKLTSELDFGVVEEITVKHNDIDIKVPIQITEEFFRPAL